MGAGGILRGDCNKVHFCLGAGNTRGAGRGWVPHSIMWGGEALQGSSISLGRRTSLWNHSPERSAAAPNWCGFAAFFFLVYSSFFSCLLLRKESTSPPP